MGSVEVFSQQLDRESDSAASLCTSSSSSSSSLTATLKPSYSFHPEPSRQSRCCTLGVVVLALHILLWTSVFVLASTVYIFLSSPPTSQYLLPEALLLSCVSLSFLCSSCCVEGSVSFRADRVFCSRHLRSFMSPFIPQRLISRVIPSLLGCIRLCLPCE